MGVDGHSTNNVISEVQSGEGLKLSLIPSVFVETVKPDILESVLIQPYAGRLIDA